MYWQTCSIAKSNLFITSIRRFWRKSGRIIGDMMGSSAIRIPQWINQGASRRRLICLVTRKRWRLGVMCLRRRLIIFFESVPAFRSIVSWFMTNMTLYLGGGIFYLWRPLCPGRVTRVKRSNMASMWYSSLMGAPMAASASVTRLTSRT